MKPNESRRTLWLVQTTNLSRSPVKAKCIVTQCPKVDVARVAEDRWRGSPVDKRYVVGTTAFSTKREALQEWWSRIHYKVKDSWFRNNKHYAWAHLRIQLGEWKAKHPRWEPSPKLAKERRPRLRLHGAPERDLRAVDVLVPTPPVAAGVIANGTLGAFAITNAMLAEATITLNAQSLAWPVAGAIYAIPETEQQ